MARDTFWFKHDSNASRDIKLLKLKHIHGFAGLGIYWSVVEFLREQDGYKFSSDESSLQLLCGVIGLDFTKFTSWFNDCINISLFVKKNNSFYSESLIYRMEIWEKNKRNGSQPKAKQEAKNKPERSIRGDKSILDKNIEDIYPFESFWNLYDKKQETKKCNAKWDNLPDTIKIKILEVLPEYIKSTPDKKFRKNPLTYLNGECWNDEIVKTELPDNVKKEPTAYPKFVD